MIALALLLAAAEPSAADAPYALTFNVGNSVFTGVYGVELERHLRDGVAPTIELGVLAGAPLAALPGRPPTVPRVGVLGQFGARWYFWSGVPEGAYVAAAGGPLAASYRDGVSGLAVLLTACAGWTFRFFEHVELSLGLGPHLFVGDVDGFGPLEQRASLAPYLRINVGAAW